MSEKEQVEIPVMGMDCADCTRHVQKAIAGLSGVNQVSVYLGSEKAVVQFDPTMVGLGAIHAAIEAAGYSVPEDADRSAEVSTRTNFTRPILIVLGGLFAFVLFVAIAGEWLGLFESINDRVPWYLGMLLVALVGYPVFRNVIRAAINKQVIAHTLMTVGVLAALVIGQWITALLIVFFMRVGDYVERFTAERARRAVRDLAALAPQTARVVRDEAEVEIPVEGVRPGETVIVRPGERIPVDGEVTNGLAYVDQATITGESLPIEASPGTHVYASTIAERGSLRIRTMKVGKDTTFGSVIRMVEHAEANKAEVQLLADRFSGYFLPVVAGIAALTFLISRDPLATAAVLVVACSCAFALATPIAMLASIGASARQGLLFKGGKYLELLERADVILIDKTGTLTQGKPEITGIQIVNPSLVLSQTELLRLAASAEKYSEHPLAQALGEASKQENLALDEPSDFEALPGLGVRARVNGYQVEVGSKRFFEQTYGRGVQAWGGEVEKNGIASLYVALNGELAGGFYVSDMMRPEVPQAIRQIQELGIQKIELLTGDSEQVAEPLARQLGVRYQAGLLPEAKIQVVRAYQAKGHTVVMIGDGVNDAPALAQADVGIAMGAAGSDVAVEAAHIALMREDWTLIPEAIRIARRTMRVVRTNIGFTAFYNLVGLTLAAFGILPPILAAAAQSLPDLGILANSSRLLRQKN